ncbi:MAG: hypothetical protein H8D62_01170, partial [Bacteroidetes bacterium]|nr:hypothetical protein [Bacteroidota bacterium]
MKHNYFLLSILVLSLSSCVITIDSSNGRFTDEIYYSEAEYAKQATQDELVAEQYAEDYQEEYVA